ncbi:hypothetical protein EUX98_g5534 [Antrodiella citrinella]|uniref:SET domain-containing protein n=1 Tax=Antrodiella citrinella TaxID=2447956 RepID=A0A4S4MRC1_9APHY|nr:hypothetical protein EUX98_g5534 [Antrodiella citrinella]
MNVDEVRTLNQDKVNENPSGESAALDNIVPALDDLAIVADTSTDMVAAAPTVSAPAPTSTLAGPSSKPVEAVPVAFKSTSLAMLRVPAKVRIHGSLYGGAEGFFKNALAPAAARKASVLPLPRSEKRKSISDAPPQPLSSVPPAQVRQQGPDPVSAVSPRPDPKSAQIKAPAPEPSASPVASAVQRNEREQSLPSFDEVLAYALKSKSATKDGAPMDIPVSTTKDDLKSIELIDLTLSDNEDDTVVPQSTQVTTAVKQPHITSATFIPKIERPQPLTRSARPSSPLPLPRSKLLKIGSAAPPRGPSPMPPPREPTPPLPLPRNPLPPRRTPSPQQDFNSPRVRAGHIVLSSPGEDSSEADEVNGMLQEASDLDVVVQVEAEDEDVQPVPRRRRSMRQRNRLVSAELDDLPGMRSARSSSSDASSLRGVPRTSRTRLKAAKRQRTPVLDFLLSNEMRQVVEASGGTIQVWERDYTDIAREFAGFYALASELPTMLEDELNALSQSVRYAGDIQRKIFEARIRSAEEATTRGPPIRIINDIDDEMTPPIDFHYTNLMYHGGSVPRPDIENLKGCGCHGTCNPFNTRCSCMRRNWEQLKTYLPEGARFNGCVYDKDGRTVHNLIPIFECNAACNCEDNCQNRVVQHGRQVAVDIKKTYDKGWGIFATKPIPAMSFVGIYAGEYLTDSEGEMRGSIYNHFDRSYLFDIDFWYLKKGGEDNDDVKYCVDAYHAGNFTRYLNHSCDPNCVINPVYINEANPDKALLTIFTQKNVKMGEELCFCYFGDPEDEDNKKVQAVKPLGAVFVNCNTRNVLLYI